MKVKNCSLSASLYCAVKTFVKTRESHSLCSSSKPSPVGKWRDCRFYWGGPLFDTRFLDTVEWASLYRITQQTPRQGSTCRPDEQRYSKFAFKYFHVITVIQRSSSCFLLWYRETSLRWPQIITFKCDRFNKVINSKNRIKTPAFVSWILFCWCRIKKLKSIYFVF